MTCPHCHCVNLIKTQQVRSKELWDERDLTYCSGGTPNKIIKNNSQVINQITCHYFEDLYCFNNSNVSPSGGLILFLRQLSKGGSSLNISSCCGRGNPAVPLQMSSLCISKDMQVCDQLLAGQLLMCP